MKLGYILTVNNNQIFILKIQYSFHVYNDTDVISHQPPFEL